MDEDDETSFWLGRDRSHEFWTKDINSKQINRVVSRVAVRFRSRKGPNRRMGLINVLEQKLDVPWFSISWI